MNYSSINYYHPNLNRPKKNYFYLTKWIGLVILLWLISIIIVPRVYKFFNQGPLVLGISAQGLESYNYQDQFLKQIVTDHLKDKDGEYAIYIESLDQNKPKIKYAQNEQVVFQSGSLYKLFLLATVLDEIQKGNLKSEDTLEADLSYLKQELEFTEFGYEDSPPKVTMTVEKALDRISTVSDNYAAFMLAQKVSWEKVQNTANQIGAKQTIIKSPISTTASDIALFYRKLYKKQLISPQVSDQLITLLEKAQINDRIPAYLPDDIQIIHKTGELPQIRHDAGIVYLPDQKYDYLIVLMSRDVVYEDQAVETLATLSKKVYDYFNSLD